ncbi:MAG: 2-oxoacid:acceptor oxidoreductase family protein [Anaerolineae bacterium]|nr:2-oxoacid:acceptor oxidoreductase family protein [Anaerolineae bacterium]MDH7474030.1 2-oxoacid:acceptor oxidoreductase family protein [Anaerolineae bacterium]
MIEIRIHGRGGQGAVIASEVLADAVFQEGKYVQSFPAFGVERRGAPVTAFTRINDKPIRIRTQIYTPDHIMVLDPTLLEVVDVTAGLKDGAWILINSAKPPHTFTFPDRYRVATVDANAIAVKYHLGPRNAPIINTAILGAFARLTGIVSLETLCNAVRAAVPINPEGNVAAVKEAYEQVIGDGQ